MRARVLVDVFAGLIAGAFVLSFTLSLAALIFSGDVVRYLPAGIGVLLVSSFVLGIAIALRSSFRPITAAAQDNTGVILAIVAADIQRAAAGADVLATVIAALALTSVLTGATFYLLGKFRLGKLVRFMPYPVVGGFLAGTGWLLVQGSLSVMSGTTVSLGHLDALASIDAARWLPGALLGAFLALFLRRVKHHLALPIVLGMSFVAFFAVIFASGLGLDGAASRGLLLGPLPAGGLWPPIGREALGHIDLSFVRHELGNIAACVLLAVIGALLNASGYEMATDQDVDQDRELRVTGLANILTGIAGGAPGWMLLGGSMLSFRSGARTRLAGVIAACVCLVPLLAGTGVIGDFPKPLLGALLCWLGLSFLIENLYDSWFRLPRGEYALVIAILAVVVGVGFLEGVAFGIVVSSFLFALNYARVPLVRHEVTGELVRSKAARSLSDEAILRRDGKRVLVLQLEGYVFFGTAHGLLQRVKERAGAVDFVIVDFRHVHGLDASAIVSFARMKRLAVTLVFTELPDVVRRQLARGGADPAHECPDLDRGLELCERQLIERAGVAPPTSQVKTAIASIVGDEGLAARLLTFFATVHVAAGAEVFRAGDASDALYVVESGEAEAWVDLGGGKSRRLRAMGPGTVIGESGIYLGSARSAGVRASQPCVLLKMTAVELDRLARDEPAIAAAFHRYIAATLADRIVTTTSASQVLLA